MSNQKRSGLSAFLIINLLTCFLRTTSFAAENKIVSRSQTQMVLLTPELRRQPDAFSIELLEPISHAPAVISFYSMLGVKVFERSLALDSPASAIPLSILSEDIAALPSGYYFYDLQAASSAAGVQFSDSLLFRDISDSNLPAVLTHGDFSRFGDVNGDGFADLLLSRVLAIGQPRILINDGMGRFVDETANRMPSTRFFTVDIELFDVDQDSDLDIFFVAEDAMSMFGKSANRLYLNDGNGNFSEVSETHLPVLPVLSKNAAWGFVNQDPFPDLVITGLVRGNEPFVSSLFVLINDGTGRFSDESDSFLPQDLGYGVIDVVLADINGDKRQDIALATWEITITDETGPVPVFVYSGQNALLIQNDENKFIDETANRMPLACEPTKLIKITDINNNAAPDLYVINLSHLTDVHHRLYLNDGTGVFEDATANLLPQQDITFLNDVIFKDYNGNGYVDMYLVNVNPRAPNPAAPDFLNLNIGGFMSDASGELPMRFDFGISAVSADINRDGDADIFVSNSSGALDPAKDTLLENLTVIVSVHGMPETIPAGIFLSQNYPNPFNPATTISYSLSKAGDMTLKIYDLQGREVASLVDGWVPSGEHRYQWDAGGLASGVYYYHLEADGFVDTRKLVLMK